MYRCTYKLTDTYGCVCPYVNIHVMWVVECEKKINDDHNNNDE